MKFLALKALSVALALAIVACGTSPEKTSSCNARPLSDNQLWDVIALDLKKKGVSRDRQTVDLIIKRRDCRYEILVTFLPAKPGGHGFWDIDENGVITDYVPGR